MEVVSIKGQARDTFGKGPNKVLRDGGRIPAVLYSKENVVHFSTTHKEIKSLIYTPDFKKAEIEIDGKNHACIIQDIDFHPVTDAIVHVDFLELVDSLPVRTEVPVRFVGTSPGVKEGGILIQTMRKVKIKCLPKDLVEELIVDISDLELGKATRVSNITVPNGVEIMSDAGTPVANVEVPRALKADDEELDEMVVEGDEGAEATEEATEEA